MTRFVLPCVTWAIVVGVALGQPPAVTPETFPTIHGLIKRDANEWAWQEIPWQLSLRDAQKLAAAQGKPIYLATCAQGCATGCL